MQSKEVEADASFYKKYAEAMPQMAFIADADGNIIYYNQRWYDYIGEMADTEGWGWKEKSIHHPDDLRATIESWNHSLRSGESYEIEYRLRRHDGEYRWHLGRAEPIRDENGEIEMWLGTNTDIHNSRLALQQSKENEEKYRSLFETMDQGFCILEMIFDEEADPVDYRFIEINPTFETQTGLKNAKGKTARELVPDLEEHWFKIYGEVALTGKSKYFTEGSEAMGRWFDVHAFKIGGESSRRVALLFTDITQRKVTEKKLKQAQDLLQLALSAGSIDVWVWDIIKDRFVTGDLIANVFAINDTALKSEGLPLAELKKAIHPDDIDRVNELIERSIKTGEIYEAEYRVKGADEKIRWVIARGKVEYDDNGKPTRFPGVLVDITERKMAEENLQKSHSQLELITDAIGAFIGYVDKDEKYQFVNKTYEKWFDFSKEHLIGKSIKDVLDNETFEKSIGNIRKALQGETIYFENTIKKDDQFRNIEVEYFPDISKNGDVLGFTVIGHDITERKMAEAALRQSEKDFRTLADNIPNLCWMTDAEGWIYWYNSRWYEYTGTDLEEMKGWGWKKVHHPDHVDRVVDKFSEHIRKGEIWEDIFPIRGKDGKYRWFLSRAIPVRDEDGNIEKWFGTNTDITERENLARQKDEFISIASHELKTPLTIVKAYMQLLEKNIDNPVLNGYLSKTHDYVDQLQVLIADLLDVSKILAGKLQFQFEKLDFEKLVRNTADSVANVHETHKISIISTLNNPIKTVDKIRLEQVLINLLTNAIKYSPESDIVEIYASDEDSHLKVAVTDFGIGISDTDKKSLFNRFYRVDEKSDQFSGLGIGLYIVAEIIKGHNGQVWVESEEGKGSTFYFTVPEPSI